MATLAAYPEWYDRSGNVVPRTDITEVEIVNSYTITGNEAVSWNAASEGSIPCHIVETKLIIVWDSMTEIPDRMFARFIALQKVVGLQTVERIGAWSFLHTPALAYIDIVPERLLSIGNDAFRGSDIEERLDLSGVSLEIIGDRATRRKRWSEEGMTAVQSVEFPSDIIYLDVPNADSQLKYADIPYAIHNGETISIATGACRTLSCYHAWNALYAGTDKEYPDFITWFNSKLNADGKYAEKTELNETNRIRDYETLGWNQTDWEYIASEVQLKYILNELVNGFPVYITMRSVQGYHSVVCIGCDASTRKLAIVDSVISKDAGIVYWNKYEDLFSEGTADTSEVIRKLDYHQPVLAPSDSWYSQGGTTIAKSTITEIDIVRSYTPTGNETFRWDASVKKNGSVMAYVNGTKLTIAGNGDNFIYANPDSSYIFSDANQSFYTSLVKIEGAEFLNTRKVRALTAAFWNCSALTSVNVSNWDTLNCIRMDRVFQILLSLQELDVSKWNTSKVTTMRMMFQGNKKKGTSGLISVGDLSNWDTSNVEDMAAMFNYCSNLRAVDIGKWDVSKVTSFQNMFIHCLSLKELDFSNWDTSNATTALDMLTEVFNLKKITVGANFDFKEAVLHSPSAEYIPYADGSWYDYDYNAYAPADIPSNVARTYYASKFIAAGDDDEMVFVKNGTLRKMAVAIRYKSEKNDTMLPSEFAEKVLAL